MNLTPDQSRYLVTLVPGEAAVFTDGMDYPVLARMPDGTARETAAPAPAAPPAGIIAPRSASCAPGCGTSPCTLRQMRAAQNAAARDPRITLWAELAVRGAPDRLVDAHGRARLRRRAGGDEGRLRDCALSHAADEAVASQDAGDRRGESAVPRLRRTSPSRYVPPSTRGAGHATRTNRSGSRPPGSGQACSTNCAPGTAIIPAAVRIPIPPELEARYCRAIPGRSCAEQVAAVQRWHDAAQRDPRTLHAVAFGVSDAQRAWSAPSARARPTRNGSSAWPTRSLSSRTPAGLSSRFAHRSRRPISEHRHARYQDRQAGSR